MRTPDGYEGARKHPDTTAARSAGGGSAEQVQQHQGGGGATALWTDTSILVRKLRRSSIPIGLTFLFNRNKFSRPTALWRFISMLAAVLMSHSEQPGSFILITEM